MQSATDLYNSGGGFYQGSTVAPFSSQTQAALDATQNRALNGSALNDSAQTNLTGTLNGDYLNSNPYSQQAMDAANEATIRQFRDATMPTIEGSYSKAGRYGSNANSNAVGTAQNALASQISSANNNFMYNQYNDERQRQLQAAGLSPSVSATDYTDLQALTGVGQTYDTQAQNQLNDQIAKSEQQRTALDEYISRINGLSSGYGTSAKTGTTSSNKLAGALGGAANGAYLGSWAGPVGMGTGATLGALTGLFG